MSTEFPILFIFPAPAWEIGVLTSVSCAAPQTGLAAFVIQSPFRMRSVFFHAADRVGVFASCTWSDFFTHFLFGDRGGRGFAAVDTEAHEWNNQKSGDCKDDGAKICTSKRNVDIRLPFLCMRQHGAVDCSGDGEAERHREPHRRL